MVEQPSALRIPSAVADFAASGAFAMLGLSAVTVAVDGPPLLALSAAGLALIAGAATFIPSGKARHGADVGAIAVTTREGALVSASTAFAQMMAARGLPAHPDALGTTGDAALALLTLRRRALAGGSAEGFLPPDLFARVALEGDRLVHAFELRALATADAETLAETLVALVPAATVVAERDGTILAANDGFHAIAGTGLRLEDGLVLEPGSLARLAAPAGARVDVPLRAAPDRRVRLTAKPFAGSRVIIAVHDVTEQSDLEAQIAQSQKMQAIGQLAGGIAHDFNNVLQAIVGFSDLLLQSHRPSDPSFRDIMNIKQSAQRAAGLVKQLLAFSRRQTLRPTVLNLNDVLADLSVMLDRLLGETIRLDLQYGRDLGPVLADPSQIEQVVINLAVNARDAMPAGGTLTIRTKNVSRSAVEGEDALETDAVLIEVEDVGTGMPSHVLEKIFEPFFTTKATGAGTGLGLSTVYGIVKQTGGTLAVDSTEGRGTTFRVYLPRTAAEAKVADERPREAAVGDLTGSATLLLVEDEEAIRAFAARALQAKGYRVLAASSGVEAVEIFEREKAEIDLVLTDVIMPELDGPSLVREVRAKRPDLKVIFMSGYADGASLDDVENAQFLPKPFTLKALAEAVKRELGRP